MAPAEPQQIIIHCLGQHAQLVTIGINAHRAMTLGELGPIRSMNQRNMRVGRLRPAHRFDDAKLTKRIVEMVIAADHMGHAHIMIIHHHGEHIGRRAIGAQQDHVIQLGILHHDAALHRILNDALALAQCLQSNDERLVAAFRRITIPPAPVIAHRLLGGALLLAQCGKLFLRRKAFIGMARVQQRIGDFGMSRGPRKLEHRLFITGKTKPGEAIENRLYRRLGGAGAIRILDAQQKFAAMMARKEVIE